MWLCWRHRQTVLTDINVPHVALRGREISDEEGDHRLVPSSSKEVFHADVAVCVLYCWGQGLSIRVCLGPVIERTNHWGFYWL